MRNRMKYLAVMLALVMSVGLVGCGAKPTVGKITNTEFKKAEDTKEEIKNNTDTTAVSVNKENSVDFKEFKIQIKETPVTEDVEAETKNTITTTSKSTNTDKKKTDTETKTKAETGSTSIEINTNTNTNTGNSGNLINSNNTNIGSIDNKPNNTESSDNIGTQPSRNTENTVAKVCKVCGSSTGSSHSEKYKEKIFVQTRSAWDEPVYEYIPKRTCGCGWIGLASEASAHHQAHWDNEGIDYNDSNIGDYDDWELVDVIHHEAEGYYDEVTKIRQVPHVY